MKRPELRTRERVFAACPRPPDSALMTGIDKVPSRSEQRPERITIREDQMKGRVRVGFQHGARLDTTDLRPYQTRLDFAKHSLFPPCSTLTVDQRALSSDPEDPHVHFGRHVVGDANPTALFHPDSLETATIFKRVSGKCRQCAGNHYFFDSTTPEGTVLITRFLITYSYGFEALVQCHALQTYAKTEHSVINLSQSRTFSEH